MKAYAYGNEIGGIVNDTRKITQAEYNALTEAEKNNGCIYVITDADNVRNLYGENITSADNIKYDDTQTALGADNVSGAIGALNSKLVTKEYTSSTTSDGKIVLPTELDGKRILAVTSNLNYTFIAPYTYSGRVTGFFVFDVPSMALHTKVESVTIKVTYMN